MCTEFNEMDFNIYNRSKAIASNLMFKMIETLVDFIYFALILLHISRIKWSRMWLNVS